MISQGTRAQGLSVAMFLFNTDTVSAETSGMYGRYVHGSVLKALADAADAGGGWSAYPDPMHGCDGDLFEQSQLGETPALAVMRQWLSANKYQVDTSCVQAEFIARVGDGRSLGYIPYALSIGPMPTSLATAADDSLKASGVVGYVGMLMLAGSVSLQTISKELHIVPELKITCGQVTGTMAGAADIREAGLNKSARGPAISVSPTIPSRPTLPPHGRAGEVSQAPEGIEHGGPGAGGSRRTALRQARQSRPQLVCILADDSGSMAGEKARAATQGIQEMLIECQSQGPPGPDRTYFRFLLIRFGDIATVDPHCDMRSVREIDPDSIALLGNGGQTNITAALDLLLSRLEPYVDGLQGHPELDRHPVPLVLLFSDGQHNVGESPLAAADRIKQLELGPDDPINIVSVGITIGNDAVDERTLSAIASPGLYTSISHVQDLSTLIASVASSGASRPEDLRRKLNQSGGI